MTPTLTFTAVETWKAVPGYEGLYEVSDQGWVRSVARLAIGHNPRHPGGTRSIRHSSFLLRQATREGYRRVSLSCPMGKRSHTVHSLVARAFLGPRPSGHDVRHLDGDREHNQLNNLAYGTRAENMGDARRHGTIPQGERKVNARLTEDNVRLIRASEAPNTHLAREYGVSDVTIRNIRLGRKWAHAA